MRCDRCNAAARYEVFTDWGALYFCGHHHRELEPSLNPDWSTYYIAPEEPSATLTATPQDQQAI